MNIYMDTPQNSGWIGLVPENGETVIPTGATIHAMPLCVKRAEGDSYERFARDYDIRFLFEDDVPAVDFYTVPMVSIAAVDSHGGLLASVGRAFDLQSSMPVVYISGERKCYLITNDSTELLTIAPHWKERLRPYDGVKIYASKQEAKRDFDIEDLPPASGEIKCQTGGASICQL